MRLPIISFLLFTSFALTACTSMSSSTNEENDRKISTAKINVQLGMAYLEQKNVQRAKRKLLLALDEAPTIPETWYSMAYFLEATGNSKEANAYYLKAIALAPSRGDVQNNYGTYLCRSGEYKQSIKHFLVAVQDPDYIDTADAYENAGLCALKIPDTQSAIEYFNHALAQDTHRPVALRELVKLTQQRNLPKKT